MSKGEGRDGEVAIVSNGIMSCHAPQLIEIVQDANPDVLIDIDSVSDLHRGWIPGMNSP